MEFKEDFIKELFRNYRSQLGLLRDMKFSKNVDNVSHQQVIPHATYSPWYDDDEFLLVYHKIKDNTLVDIYRCYELWSLIMRSGGIKGDILEVGVWRGGTGSLISCAAAKVSTECRVYLADTFAGVVKASENDTRYKGGEHSDTSMDSVRNLLKAVGVSNAVLLKGIFPDQVNFGSSIPQFRLCHIDVDTYDSARDVFEYVWPHIVRGGVVVFDDYGFWGCEGVTKLCNEFRFEDGFFVHNLNGHCLMIKTK